MEQGRTQPQSHTAGALDALPLLGQAYALPLLRQAYALLSQGPAVAASTHRAVIYSPATVLRMC